jgi:hypothetical protein
MNGFIFIVHTEIDKYIVLVELKTPCLYRSVYDTDTGTVVNSTKYSQSTLSFIDNIINTRFVTANHIVQS